MAISSNFVRSEGWQLHASATSVSSSTIKAAGQRCFHATKPAVRELPLADYIAQQRKHRGLVSRLRTDVQVTP